MITWIIASVSVLPTLILGSPVSPQVLLLFSLALTSVLAGVLAGTIGAGGILLVTILYLMTALTSAAVAGTSAAIFILGSIGGTIAYTRSGEMDWRMATALGIGAFFGTRLGAEINLWLSERLFRIALATALIATGITIFYRELRGLSPRQLVTMDSWQDYPLLIGSGVIIGAMGGLFGVGGPLFAVPLLLLLGVSLLTAVAVGQTLAVLITVSTTLIYLPLGGVNTTLVLINGPLFLIGTILGWRLAHRIDKEWLKGLLGVVIIIVGGYLFV